MRIIGGIAKKKKLISPISSVRPTSDRIKETLFNLLGDIKETIFLDLFAGTGNIGIEAISRGASSAYFVEKSSGLCNIIKKNLRATAFEQKGTVLNREVKKSLFHLFRKKDIFFNTIFADPPYEKGMVKKLFSFIELNLLTEDGYFVLQHSLREKPDLEPVRVIKIGDTLLSFFDNKKSMKESTKKTAELRYLTKEG